jgi:BON domain-containing protein
MPKTTRRWFGLRAGRDETSHQSTTDGWSSWPGEAADRMRDASGLMRDASGLVRDASGRVRDASHNLPSLKEVRMPEVRMPDVRLPEMRMPEVRLPDIRLPQLRRRTPWYQRAWPTAAVAGIAVAGGAAIAYFLDPERGRARRAQTVDRLAGTVRRTADSAARAGRKLSSDAEGWTNMVVSLPARRNREPLDDATLAHKVETELFRDPDFDKGKVNINAENGIIVVRGEVPMDVARQIEIRVRRIDGVKEVQNLLHEPEFDAEPKSRETETTGSESTSSTAPTESTPRGM